MLDKIQPLAVDLSRARERHHSRFKNQVEQLIFRIEEEYKKEVREILSFLTRDKKLAAIISPGYKILEKILIDNRWVGWELCDLGPVLNLQPVREFPIAMIVYLAVHLIDDGIDGHEVYENTGGKSYYGYLLEEKLGERESSALSAMVGMAIINASLRRLMEKNIYDSLHTLLRLSSQVFAGMMAESLYPAPLTLGTYRQVIRSKAIAYQMILEHVFLQQAPQDLRSELLKLRSRLIEIGQMTDDLTDEKVDLSSNRFTILAVKDMSREKLIPLIHRSMDELWCSCNRISPELKDAMGKHLFNWVTFLLREIENE